MSELIHSLPLRIGDDGGIKVSLPERDVIIDGHAPGALRVVTHIHTDHTRGLGKTISSSGTVAGTPLTLDWLKALGYHLSKRNRIPLNYNQKLSLGGSANLELKYAYHIPGSSQVLMEFSNGLRVVYTSDFKKPVERTPVIQADVLVIDAVYGDPSFRRPFDDYIEEVLTDFVRELLARGPVHIYGYYGKVQEVMEILRRNDLDAPFILSHKQYLLTKIAERYGMEFGDYVHVNSREAEDIIRDGWYVFFTHLSGSRRQFNGLGSHVILSGWEFSRPYRRLGSRRWLVAFSDHADFNGLIKYIEESGPRLVIVNNRRSVRGEVFASYIKNRLGVKTLLLP